MSLHNFEWVVRGELAAMAMPDGRPGDWRQLRELGIGAVVNLTFHRHGSEGPEEHGLDYLHLPIEDFEPPAAEQVDRFVEFCDRELEADRALAVHCRAGRGRTGTMLACYLVHRGMDADQAIDFVRSVRRGAIETAEQEGAVRGYARRQSEE